MFSERMRDVNSLGRLSESDRCGTGRGWNSKIEVARALRLSSLDGREPLQPISPFDNCEEDNRDMKLKIAR